MIGDILGGLFNIGGGIAAMVQAERLKQQRMDLLRDSQNLYNNFILPIQKKANAASFGQFKASIVNTGMDIRSYGAQAALTEESNRLASDLSLSRQKQELDFRAQQNEIQNKYLAEITGGAMQFGKGLASTGTGIASGITFKSL